jgi:DNA-binding NtrC family response regulator
MRVDLSGIRLRDAEQEMIVQTLAACGGNKTRAAASLGISVKTLYNKLKRFEALERGSS